MAIAKETETTVEIPANGAILAGDLTLPTVTTSLVIFAHGSGSSRLSPRNRYVASVLQSGGIGTLLFDLLTPEEDANYEMRFDIDLLTQRLGVATIWAQAHVDLLSFPVGYFGASTGAAAALRAAALLPDRISAVVSRGGRPDLAMQHLGLVKAPTLLIVGGLDDVVIELNKKAFAAIRAEKDLQIVAGATHLFEEPGTLEKAARLASDWFSRHLTRFPS